MFDCDSYAHKVQQATVYSSRGFVIKSINDGEIEDVIPGSVGEAIRNFVCDYDMKNDVSTKGF